MSAGKDVEGPLSPGELASLEAAVVDALEAGDERGLEVIGYGEISCVIALEAKRGRYACKRLPRFDRPDRFERYSRTFQEYLAALSAVGIRVLDSRLQTTPAAGGGLTAYCMQPLLSPDELAPRALAAASEEAGAVMAEAIVEATSRAISPRLGVDAQLSNWAFPAGQLAFLDVTTPMLRDEQGRDVLDTSLFIASLPWLLRGPVKWFVVRGIIDKYHSPRGVLLDLVGNLFKERLERWLPVFLASINRRVSPPITEEEARRYYEGDARMWELLQRLRRLDRVWQRKVRRRVYPFILPGNIER